MNQSQQSSGVVLLQWVDEAKKEQARRLRKRATPAEKLLWEELRNNAVSGMKFRRQQAIEGFIVDFFCHKAKLVIEIDGSVHDTPEQKMLDKKRRDVFDARGLHEIRFRNEEVLSDVMNVVATIRDLVDRRLR
jgi:very-short-patch-repair endonuclease